MATKLFTIEANDRTSIDEFSGSTFTDRLTSAINAINAGNNISVYIPRGQYQLTADVPDITGDQWEIFGEGQATQIFAQSGGSVTRFFQCGTASTRADRGRIHSLYLDYNNTIASTVYGFELLNCQYIHINDIFCSGFAGVVECGGATTKAIRCNIDNLQGNVSNGLDTNGHIKINNASRLEFNSIAFSDSTVSPRTGALILMSAVSGGLIDDMRFNDVSFQTFSQDQNHAQIGVDTATMGTGTITLGSALSGKQLFSHAVTDGDTVYYRIDDGANFEEGLGVYTASGTTLTRDTILDGSSGAGNPISLSGSGVEVTVPVDGKPYGMDFNTTNGNIVNVWVNDQVIDHTTTIGLRMRGTGSSGFTNINFDDLRVSTDAGQGINITNGSSDQWRDIAIDNSLVVIDDASTAITIDTTSTGKFYDCHLTDTRISESDPTQTKTQAINFAAEGGWRIEGTATKQRSGTTHGFNYGLTTTDTGLERFFCINNDFSACNTGAVNHATYAAVSKSRYFGGNLGPDGLEDEPPPTIASASTVDLSTTTSEMVVISGTTTITSFGTAAATGTVKYLYFTGALTLTHSSSLRCPDNADFDVSANHMVTALKYASGWVVTPSVISGGSPFTDEVVINGSVSTNATVTINKNASGDRNLIFGQTGTSNRWRIDLGDSVAEAGSDAGSRFTLTSYDDAGTQKDVIMIAERDTGNVTFHDRVIGGGAAPVDGAELANKTYVDAVTDGADWATYSETQTWDGTAPSGTNSSVFTWAQAGQWVTVHIHARWATPGVSNTQVELPLPSACPAPSIPSIVTATDSIYGEATGFIFATDTEADAATSRAWTKYDGTSNIIGHVVDGSHSAIGAICVFSYRTNA